MRTRFIALLVTLAALAPAALTGSGAAEPSYQIPVWFTRGSTVLDVLIVPPNHGQIFNGNGALGGGDPAEATPFNSYLRAIEDAIAQWDRAVAMFAEPWLATSFVTNVYVLGRDTPPPAALTDPEIVILTDETKANTLGIAFSTDPCINDNSKFFVTSFTYEDMYNVGAHEFGHCLGLNHVVDSQPPHDTMAATYVDPVGARGNHLHCPSNLDVKGLEAVFAAAGGRPPASTASVPVDAYTTSCGAGAPAPAASSAPPGSPSPTSAPTASPTPTPTATPTAAPTPSPTPSDTPPPPSPTPTPAASPTATPTPSPSPSPTPEEHDRSITLLLRRHLVARGRVAAADGFTPCEAGVEVRISRRAGGAWIGVATTTTGSSGTFRVRFGDRPGRYRAEVSTTSDGSRTCSAAASSGRRHRHRGA